MKTYHYTYQERLESILENGLIPSSGYGENLPFILMTDEPYKPENGYRIYLQIEIDVNDPKPHYVNQHWIEYYGVITPDKIKAIARDFTNDIIFDYVRNGGDLDNFDSVFCQYKEL